MVTQFHRKNVILKVCMSV